MSKRHVQNEPINQARTNLDVVLQNLIIKKEESPYTSDDPDGENEDDEDGHLQSLQSNGDYSFGGQNLSKKARSGGTQALPSSSSRKKRRRDDGLSTASPSVTAASVEHGPYQHTFIVKLFDRSVDLAQFDESTPLYPVCRAWIENQPTGGGVSRPSVSRLQLLPSDEAEHTTGATSEGQWKAEPNDEDALAQATLLHRSLKIPEPLPMPALQLFSETLSPDGAVRPATAEQFLHDHMERWKLVRQRWKHAAQRYEAQYGRSLDHLKATQNVMCKD